MSGQSHHPTEALARKAARRHGRELVRILEVVNGPVQSLLGCGCDAGIESGFYVEDSDTQGVNLRPWETLVYEGPGYACGRDVS